MQITRTLSNVRAFTLLFKTQSGNKIKKRNSEIGFRTNIIVAMSIYEI